MRYSLADFKHWSYTLHNISAHMKAPMIGNKSQWSRDRAEGFFKYRHPAVVQDLPACKFGQLEGQAEEVLMPHSIAEVMLACLDSVSTR